MIRTLLRRYESKDLAFRFLIVTFGVLVILSAVLTRDVPSTVFLFGTLYGLIGGWILHNAPVPPAASEGGTSEEDVS